MKEFGKDVHIMEETKNITMFSTLESTSTVLGPLRKIRLVQTDEGWVDLHCVPPPVDDLSSRVYDDKVDVQTHKTQLYLGGM